MSEDIQKINLDNYIQTGEGGTALTYTRKDGLSLAKLYKNGFEADRAKAEFLTARTVFELGIPSPEPYRLVTDASGTEPSMNLSSINAHTHASSRKSQSDWRKYHLSTHGQRATCQTQPCRKSWNYFKMIMAENCETSDKPVAHRLTADR